MSKPVVAKSNQWVQTELRSHERWAQLIRHAPRAAELLHELVARVGDNNAVVISQRALAKIMQRHVNTVTAAIAVLRAGNWLEVRQIGDRGTVNAYIINDRVAWFGPRDGLRYSLFSATVVASSDEQSDAADLGNQAALHRLPSLFRGERQLPSGDGLEPPSEPALPGMEPNLPALREFERHSEPLPIGQLLRGIAVAPSGEVTSELTAQGTIIEEP